MPLDNLVRFSALAWGQNDSRTFGEGKSFAEEVPFVLFNRISTGTYNGSALTVPSTFSLGEAIELRYTSAKSNAQFQGLFMEVRTSVANTSTIRGMEVKAAQGGNFAVGTLEGGNFVAYTRGDEDDNVTNMYGVSGEIQHNDSAYTGTITEAAAVRGKFSIEDGATYTDSSVFLAFGEAITGGAAIGSVLRVKQAGSVTFTNVLDVAATATNLIAADSSGQGGVNVSADGMFKDPQDHAEAGYINVKVGGTTYQVPIYASS